MPAVVLQHLIAIFVRLRGCAVEVLHRLLLVHPESSNTRKIVNHEGRLLNISADWDHCTAIVRNLGTAWGKRYGNCDFLIINILRIARNTLR